MIVLIAILAIQAIFLWWFMAFGFKEIADDRTRQRLFDLRHRLLMAAAEDRSLFETEAYRLLCDTVNGMIRFAHDISIWNVLVLILAGRNKKLVDVFSDRWKTALDGLNAGQKEGLLALKKDMGLIMVRHMVESSCVLLLITGIFRSVHALWEYKEQMKSRITELLAKANIDSLALASHR